MSEYAAKIVITFDKAIATDPDVVNGSELRTVRETGGTPFCSTNYSGQTAALAFDGDIATYWRPSTAAVPQYIGKDFGVAKTIGKARVYLNTSYMPNAYKIQGSDNGADYTDVTSGNFIQATGWVDITFTAATFRYWRLYISSLSDSTMRIYELEFYASRPTYANTAGWVVKGNEYPYIPEGQAALVETTYTVYRVTKSGDNMAIILWLDYNHRMKYPQGTVSVQYTPATGGNIMSSDGGVLAAFMETFTPANIVPIFNPNDIDNVEIAGITPTITLTQIYYTNTADQVQGQVELATVSVTSAVLTHIDDL